MTLLKTQDGGVLTTRNTLMNYLHHPLTHITLQVLCTAIQNYLSPQKHHYFIYYLLKSLRIFKFGYPASNIVITSSPSSRTLILCVTPFSSQSLKTYGNPITIQDSSVYSMKNTTNGYIDVLSLRTLAYGCATNTRQIHQHKSPGKPLILVQFLRILKLVECPVEG